MKRVGTWVVRISQPRAYALVLGIALAAFANSLGNGFAYDDTQIIENNPAVTDGALRDVIGAPYWPNSVSGTGLYRPVPVASYLMEWRLWNGSPFGFHLGNVFGHAAVSLVLLTLLLRFVPIIPATLGAGLFAIHPLHVEAVANVVGRAEIYAAFFYLVGCLLFLVGRESRGTRRIARMIGVGGCYALALGSKEIAATLPGMLVLLGVMGAAGGRSDDAPRLREAVAAVLRRGRRIIIEDAPLFALLTAVLAGYFVARLVVLGSFAGEIPAPELVGVTGAARIYTGISLWPDYLRLLLFPLSLAADYAPGVRFPAHAFDAQVALGVITIVGLASLAAWSARTRPPVTLGIAWFALAILPVSHLVLRAGTLLAERTLYLPSVGLSFAVAGIAAGVVTRGARTRRAWSVAALVVGTALFARTVERNPSWLSTFTVLGTLAAEHPESYLAVRARATGLDRTGDFEQAASFYETALELAPGSYSLLAEVGDFYGRHEVWGRAEEVLLRATEILPDQPQAWRLLSGQLILQGRGRDGHRAAMWGLAAAGPDSELWGLVSEAYLTKGDLEASVRARRVALSLTPDSARDWGRLADVLAALDRVEEAQAARTRADELERGRP